MTITQSQVSALDRFVLKGIPFDGAVALVSVLYYESKLDPGSQGYQPSETPGVLNPHGAYGIASWNGPRQNDLLEYATKQGKVVSDLNTQLDFVLTEIANGYHASWSAIRSAASYKAIIPILVAEYENPKDKQKEIAGALAIASPLAALTPPQPAPQAPPQQIPGTPPPPPIPPILTPSQGIPPVSSTSAGRRSAEQAYVAAMLGQLLAEQAELAEEIAAFQAMAATLSKLNPAPTALPKPPDIPAVQPKGKQTMFGITNWATTLSGLPALFTAVLSIFNAIKNGQAPTSEEWGVIGASISAVLIGINAKDKNVTGGTVPATPEAQRRVAS